MRTLQLFGSGAATANAVAQVIIPSSATIMAVQAAVEIDSITDGARMRLELSKVSTSEIAVNGALDPFLSLVIAGNFVTSGLAQWGLNKTFNMRVPCRQGEIVYLHAFVAGTLIYYSNFIFHYQ